MAEQKYKNLLALLKRRERLAVAFSGGIDSTLLLYAAVEALGTGNVLPLHITSVLNSSHSLNQTREIYRENISRQLPLIEVQVYPLTWPEFVNNDERRCYFCKRKMYTTLLATMQEKGFQQLADGTNVDDLRDNRPGLLAVRELKVLTPLVEADLTKNDIRRLGREKHLTNFSLPSNSCMATRVPRLRKIDTKILQLIDAAERYLIDLGFEGCRVRAGENFTIVEVETKDIERMAENTTRHLVQNYFKTLGLDSVMLSLQGR